MAERRIPITITVSGGAQGAAEVNRLSSSFNGLNAATNQASSGGLRNSFNATNLMRSEIQSLGSQIPIVGRFFNGFTSDLLNHAKAAQQVTQQVKLQKAAYDEFTKYAEKVTRGQAPGEISTLFSFGGSKFELARDDLRNSKKVFADFVSEFQKIDDPILRASFAVDAFGKKGVDLLPVLENMSAAEVETATATAAVGTSFTAIAGPAAIALGVIIAIVGAFGLASKGGYELVKLAETQASKFQDVSDRVNFNVETLQTLNVAEIKAGGNLDKLSGGLAIFDKNITQAYESDTKLAKQFQEFNIDLDDNEKALRQVLSVLAAMPPGAKQTELAMLAFGKSGKEIIGVIHNLDGSLDEQMVKLKQMGIIMSTQDVKAAADFGDKLDLLALKIKMVGVRIGFDLMPYFERLVDRLSNYVSQNGPAIIEHFRNLATSVQALGRAFVAVETGGLVEDDDGRWLMGKLLHWGTGVGVVISVLDKIGAKIREVQGVAQGGKNPFGPPLTASGSDFQGNGAGGSWDQRGDLTTTEKELLKKNRASLQQMYDSLGDTLAELKDKSEASRVVSHANRIEIEKLPPAYAALQEQQDKSVASLRAGIAARANEVEQLKAQAKAADEAKAAAEKLQQSRDSFNAETDSMRQRLLDMAAAGGKARTEISKFQEALAGGKFKDQLGADLIRRENAAVVIDDYNKSLADTAAADKATAAQQRLADAIENVRNKVAGLDAAALPEQAQRQLEAHRALKDVADSIFNLPGVAFKGGRESLDKFVAALNSGAQPGGQGGLFEQFHSLFTDESLTSLSKLNQNTAEFVRWLQRAKVDEENLAAAQTPLGQAQREYNALLDQQRDLTDPVLTQQRLQNQLLRDKIDLESRDMTAVASLARSQAELADKSTYHAAQANAQVAELMSRTASVTQIVADAKTGVIQTTFDYLDRGLAKANSHLGRMGDLLTQIEGDFIKLAATKFFQLLFGIGGGTSSGGGGGFLGGIFGGGGPGGTPTFAGGAATLGGGASSGQSLSGQFLNFIRGGGSGRAQYAATAPFLGSLSALTNEGISIPTSLSSGSSQAGILSAVHESGHVSPALGGGGGITASLAQFAPFLGAGIGASLGSRFGIGGQIGGGLIGAGAGLVASNLLGGTALSTIAATLGISMTALAAGTFGIGAAVLIASILISRSNLRRKNETDRATLNNDTYSQIIQVLNDARGGKYDSAGAAIAAFDQIKSNYFQRIAGYDGKTKRIATEVWNDTKNGFEVYRPLISKAAQKAIEGRELAKNMIPEFALGGMVPYRTGYFSMAAGLTPIKVRPGEIMIPPGGFGMTVPGVDRGYDSVYTMARPGTRVLTKAQARGARGFATGGTVDGQAPVVVELHVDGDEANAAIIRKILGTMKSRDGQNVTVRTVASARADREL
jgi:hypothetical protein